MKILVLNGSPKGDYSITLQTSIYLSKLHPEHEFEFINVGQRIKALEKDFSEAEKMINNADLLIFSYPVYTFLAPYQLHRFIELLKEKEINLNNKYATQVSTSKHFYDVTAHRYIQDNCQEIGLKFIKGLSADMDDLPLEKGQKEAKAFFDFFIWSVENDICEPNLNSFTEPKNIAVNIPEENETDKNGDVVIIADYSKDDIQIQNMIDRFQKVFNRKTRVVNIRDYQFKGGCLGCLNCATGGECVYKDGFAEYLRKELNSAEARIFAFTIKDHSMGTQFKLYDDRSFCNGHRSVTMGMPVGYLVSGNYSEEKNVQTVIEARASVGENFLCGVATDEFKPNEEIDKLAKTLEYALDNKHTQPQNFYGVGGMKIFRDLIWVMQGFMKEDHKFYKTHNQYDFPQKKRGMMLLMYLLGGALSSPKIKAKMGNKMNEGMLMPYKKVLDDLEKK
ncbi:MAG: iron-sulfur protein [Ruminococcaceae bacterium]|nr:iron-sulfur protein [Oscillospiraceae bacterium]